MSVDTIAVTGADGFIGKAVCREIGSRQRQYVPVDRRRGVDVLNAEQLGDVLTDVDAVIHLAGVLGTAELYDSPDLAVDVNVKGTLRVLETCRDKGLAYVGITMPDVWTNLYQATKLAGKRIAEGFCRDYKVPVTHVKTFNAFGAGQAVGPGHPQKIIPTFATRSYAGEPIPIWGDGQQTVDLVHVDWIAGCLVEAALHSYDHPQFGHGETWDCGSGVEMTVLEVAKEVTQITKRPFIVEYLPMRPGETPGTKLCATEFGPFGAGEWTDAELVEAVKSYDR